MKLFVSLFFSTWITGALFKQMFLSGSPWLRHHSYFLCSLEKSQDKQLNTKGGSLSFLQGLNPVVYRHFTRLYSCNHRRCSVRVEPFRSDKHLNDRMFFIVKSRVETTSERVRRTHMASKPVCLCESETGSMHSRTEMDSLLNYIQPVVQYDLLHFCFN